MTAKQRRKKNRQPALPKSATGPRTEEGKEASRRNRLTHGLTAKTLILPGEDPEQIQAQADRLHDDLQPEGADEEALVDQMALASLRLERAAKAENAIIAEQVQSAEIQWDLKQQLRLLKLQRMLRRDRATAILKLRAFGAGVSWLLGRWKFLENTFNTAQCWNNLALIREAVLLRGLHEDRLANQTGSAYEFAHLAISCVDGGQNMPALVQFLAKCDDEGSPCVAAGKNVTEMLRAMTSYVPDVCLASTGVRTPSMDEARRTMRGWIERQVADLRELDRHFREVDARSRAGAKIRALAPADTPRNRLLLRYMKSAETFFDRSRKTLAKLQKDRQRQAENDAKSEAAEAPTTDLRNEPTASVRPHSKELAPGTYVTINGADYVVVEKGDGNVILSLVENIAQTQPREVAAALENGV
jgi:hypothetical protein